MSILAQISWKQFSGESSRMNDMVLSAASGATLNNHCVQDMTSYDPNCNLWCMRARDIMLHGISFTVTREKNLQLILLI